MVLLIIDCTEANSLRDYGIYMILIDYSQTLIESLFLKKRNWWFTALKSLKFKVNHVQDIAVRPFPICKL